MRKDLIINYEVMGEGSLFMVDEDVYDKIFEIYENQHPDGYEEAMDQIMNLIINFEDKGKVERICLQYNSHDDLQEPVTFKRILQLMIY
jgi:hypothetical protein